MRSLSCTDLEWERVRERAAGAGLSMSRYLIERGLTVELPREEGVRPQLVLDEAEQREMRDRIAAVAERVSTGSAEGDGSELLRLRRMVSFLVRAAMTDMVREGRTRRMTALLADLFGEEEAVRIAERFVARIRKDGSP